MLDAHYAMAKLAELCTFCWCILQLALLTILVEKASFRLCLKPKYSFGKIWWKWKISLMGIVHKSYKFSKPCEYFCSKPSIFVENCIKLPLSGCPWELSHRDMYIAPSSGPTSFNFNMPFKLILRRCEVACFLMSGVKILHFLKDWWKSIPIHQNYTMALTFKNTYRLMRHESV